MLQRDLARVEAIYRQHGYYEAHARAGRIYEKDPEHVEIEILVEEGPLTKIRDVRIDGLDDVPKDIADLVHKNAALEVKKDDPFEQEAFDKANTTIRRALTDRGYAYTKVKNDAVVDLVTHRADLVFTLTAGKPCTFGELTIEGLGPLPDDKVRQAADIPVGKPYSDAITESDEPG